MGNVEFKRDTRDGRLKLIECNHRFTAANELVRRAGIDLARIAYDRACGDDVPPTPAIRAATGCGTSGTCRRSWAIERTAR